MSVVSVLLAASVSGSVPVDPVLWLSPKGGLLVEGRPASARLTSGARVMQTPFGAGVDFNGTRGGILMGDLPALALTRSITVSTWVYLRSYVSDGPGAQIFFRGDDRCGVDPYHLSILSDGTVQFSVEEESGIGADVRGEVPLEQWVRITGAFDAEMGEVRLYLGDRLVSTRQTARRPFAVLDGGWSPGLGIGNVQNDHGPHNQPVNGVIADLRVYSVALEPAQAGWKPFRTGS